LIGLGVASFSHIGGTHFQNQHDFEPYLAMLREGKLPIYRALTPTDEERMIREIVLQFKLGRISRNYFQRKFDVDVLARFAQPMATLQSWGALVIDGDWLRLTREGLLQVDRLVHEFFLPEHRTARYA
jgi:oxygen-independent coproporphyrinogen-3 oxidase